MSEQEIPPNTFPADTDEALAWVMESLASKARGEGFDQERTTVAVNFILIASMYAKGISLDTACDAVEQAQKRGDIRVRWSTSEGLTITVGDGIHAWQEHEIVDARSDLERIAEETA